MHQRRSSFRTWRWCGLVCTPATTRWWTPAALSTSLQVRTDQISFKHHRCSKIFFFLWLLTNTLCNRRGQGRKGIWFPQLDSVLSSWEKRTAELLQPQLQWACKHPPHRPLTWWFILWDVSHLRFFYFFFLVDYLPWCLGDAIHVGWLLQAGRLCSHWLQPWIWLCLIQSLLHHSPWKTVSIPKCPVMLPCMWIFSDLDLLLSLIRRCRLSLGGKELIIQTYTWDNSFYGNGKKFIGSAFPATPRNWSCHLLNNKQLTE